jgi:cellulose synthase/poly-beta-1,6-N-acetylglucosamine synthase-like glycosyltransferase
VLTRLLFQAAIWFVLSMTITFLIGPRLRRTSPFLSFAWVALLLAAGDVVALRYFGRLPEVLWLTAAAAALSLFFVWRLKDWNAFGQAALLFTLIVIPFFLAYILQAAVSADLAPASFLVAMVFFFFQAVATLVALTHIFENLDVTCRVHWHHRLQQIKSAPGFTPKVSLHLPTYDEPPGVVEETLRALAALDYPNFEVLVIDNNTPKEETWRPVEAVCRELGSRFRFFHIENWPGYKSGALNFALAQTAPDAELIGIVDADYCVEPIFLKEMVPAFTDPNIAFIQAPQDYRDYRGGAYSEAVYYTYEYFFEVPMSVRSEHNAIIFAGTMGLIRTSILQEIGGWSEWCITEDAEASLRTLKRGYQSLYYHRSMGRGLMPCTFVALKRQQFRWCYGNIQILRKHWEELMPWARWLDPENRLTPAQRYRYLVGCLQWFTDGFNFAFVVFLTAGGLIRLYSANFTILPVTVPLITLAITFMVLNLWRFGWVLRNALNLSWSMAFRSMYGMFSTGWVVALASFQALFRFRTAFLRTPKIDTQEGILRTLFETEWESGIGVACLGISIAVLALTPMSSDTLLIGGLLLWQASLFLAAPIFGLFYKACPGEAEPPARAAR